MTQHIYSNWTWGNPLDYFPYAQVVNAIEAHGRKPPAAYAILNVGDSIVMHVSALLATGQELTKEAVAAATDDSEFKDDAITIMVTVLKRLDALAEDEKPG